MKFAEFCATHKYFFCNVDRRTFGIDELALIKSGFISFKLGLSQFPWADKISVCAVYFKIIFVQFVAYMCITVTFSHLKICN